MSSKNKSYRYSARLHFRKRLKYRFKFHNDFSQQLERQLMSELFMGSLKIVEEDEHGLKIHYPAIHNRCILIFNKEINVFISGYPANRSQQRRLLI